jgi:hypothetical protein
MEGYSLIDIDSISIGMEFDRFSLRFDDPNEYLYQINGKIYYTFEDNSEEDEKEDLIGAFRLLYIDATSASDNDISLYDVYNCNGEAFEFFEGASNSEDGEFNNKITELLGEEINFWGNNVLIIDRIGILPKYRGHQLGIYILQKLIQRFYHRVSVVAIRPSPFNFSADHLKQSEVDWQSPVVNDDSQEAKNLAHYYQKIGFKKLVDSAYMVLGTEKEFPKLKPF